MDELAKRDLTKMPSSLVGGERYGSGISWKSVPGLKEINAQKVISVPDPRAQTEPPHPHPPPHCGSQRGPACDNDSESSYSLTFWSPSRQPT